jgi:hypothetical protein
MRIIALSASAYDTTRAQSVSVGSNAFMSKPIRLEQIVEALGRELGLEWRRQRQNGHHATVSAPSLDAALLAGLPPALARELYELALQGDVLQLMRRLAEIRGEDGRLGNAVAALEHLGRDFDMRGLRAALKPLTGVGA